LELISIGSVIKSFSIRYYSLNYHKKTLTSKKMESPLKIKASLRKKT
jgi:hypothetical protein